MLNRAELELELILSQMAQKPMLRGEVGARRAHPWPRTQMFLMDEDDQDGLFFFNHPERGGYSAA